MEFTFSPRMMQDIMQQGIDNANNQDYTFVSTKRDKELVQAISIMESMGVRHLEIDLSEDDQSLLH
jgi:hypothetical protein